MKKGIKWHLEIRCFCLQAYISRVLVRTRQKEQLLNGRKKSQRNLCTTCLQPERMLSSTGKSHWNKHWTIKNQICVFISCCWFHFLFLVNVLQVISNLCIHQHEWEAKHNMRIDWFGWWKRGATLYVHGFCSILSTLFFLTLHPVWKLFYF